MDRLRRFLPYLLLGLLLPGAVNAQNANPWSKMVPVRSFGYGNLTSMQWSPVNGQLAVASDTGMQFYDESLTLEGERRLQDVGTFGSVMSFSPDIQYAVLYEADGLIIRDTTTWEPILALDEAWMPFWSPNSQYIAVWAYEGLQIWDVARGRMVREFKELISQQGVIQWSPDSQVIAVAGPGAIVMLRVDTGDIVRIHAFDTVANFAWSSDGVWLVVIGRKDPLPLDFDYEKNLVEDDLLRVNALTGDVVQEYDVSLPIEAEFYSATGHISVSSRYIAAGLKYSRRYVEDDEEFLEWRGAGMGIWDLESGEALHQTLYDPFARIHELVWSRDGKRFAAQVDASLQIYDASTGERSSILTAYIGGYRPVVWMDAGIGAADGLWDVNADYPQFAREMEVDEPPEDFFQPAPEVECTNYYTDLCPESIVFDPTAYDYNMPPWTFELVHNIPERSLAITYEIEIEYPGTPEAEDGEPPYERYVLWDTDTGYRMERYLYMNGRQDAWIYDLPNPNIVESESRAFNILRNTYFIAINDDTILNVRTGEETYFEGLNRWEWRQTWFSPDEGKVIYAHDTDMRFKVFDPWTGEMLYQTVPAPLENLYYSHDFQLTYVLDFQNVTHIYETYTGEKILEIYTDNLQPEFLWNTDRSLVAIGGDNRGIVIVDVPNQERLAVLRGHRAAVTSLAWNPDCDYANVENCRYVLASSDASGQVILWGHPDDGALVQTVTDVPADPTFDLPVAEVDYATLEPLWVYISGVDHFGAARAHTVRWSSGGIEINGETYYNTDFDLLRNIPDAPDWVLPADVRGDGRAVFSTGHVVARDGRIVSEIAYSRYSAVDATFTRAGDSFLTAHTAPFNTYLGWVREWSTESGRPITNWGGGNPGFSHIERSPDGQWLATVTIPNDFFTPRVQIWDANRFNFQHSSLIGHYRRIVALYWQGENVLTASFDGSVRLWDIHTGEPLARWNQPNGMPILMMRRADADSMLLSAGDDLVVLNANTLQQERTFSGFGGGAFDWSPDGTQIIAIARDNVVRVIDFASGEVVNANYQHQPEIASLEWHPSKDELVVARRDGSLVILDGETGEQARMLRPYGDAVRGMVWSPDGSKLLLDLENGGIDILDSASGETISHIENQWRRRGVWWSPDSSKIAFGTYPNPDVSVYNAPSLVQIHDAGSGDLLQALDLEWRDYIFYVNKKPFTLVWSPDGERLAAIYVGRLRMWDWASGEMLITPQEKLGTAVGLTIWDEDADVLRIWMTDATWRLNIASDSLEKFANEGLPFGTELRSDGTVMLASQYVVEYNTFYPLQDIGLSYADADWHPRCWSSDCPAVLAVASGSQVMMYGYGAGQ